jgi:hypothetical protein
MCAIKKGSVCTEESPEGRFLHERGITAPETAGLHPPSI